MSADHNLRCQLDHLVVCTSHLESGVDRFAQLSGVNLPFGGHHPLMATHNHLTALSQNSFLEIIATDPQAAPVKHSRWFNLDDELFQQELRQSPCLATWVVGTHDLPAALAAVRGVGIDVGEPVMQRREDMQWQIALRADGTLACDGVFPILIEWPEGLNPVSRMRNQGLRLDSLSLSHPQADRIFAGLRALGADSLVTLQTGEVSLTAQMSVGSHHFKLHNRPIS